MSKSEILSAIDNEINKLNNLLGQITSAPIYIEVRAKLDSYKELRDFIQSNLDEAKKETTSK